MTPGGHRRYRYLDVMALRDGLMAQDKSPHNTPPAF
jgi:hypothetical protein